MATGPSCAHVIAVYLSGLQMCEEAWSRRDRQARRSSVPMAVVVCVRGRERLATVESDGPWLQRSPAPRSSADEWPLM